MSITRKAILIGSPYATVFNPPPEPVLSVKDDVNAWTYFLQAPVGGCWANGSEIVNGSSCSFAQLKEYCEKTEHVDYIFFVYSGHGFSNNGVDYVFLSNGQEIVKVDEIIDLLASFANMGTIIFDACRIDTPTTKLEPNFHFTQSMQERSLEKDAAAVRAYWESKFPSSASGFVIIKSCDVGEESYMMRDAPGSVYCTKMINIGLCSEYSVSVIKAFNDAAQEATDEVASWRDPKKQQHPLKYGNSLKYPFCLGTREILNVQANGWI